MKNCNMTLIERQLRYLHYHELKSINMSISRVKTLPTQQHRLIEKGKSSNYPLVEAFKN